MKYVADFVFLVHFLFIIFVVFGSILNFWKKWLIFLHIPAVIWGILVEFNGWICPLTPLENHFRKMAQQSGYENGFIEYYMAPIIYPSGLTSRIKLVLGVILILINLVSYYILLRKIKS